MTKKSHQKFLLLKWKSFQKKRHLGQRKFFPSPQTRRQVSATGKGIVIITFILVKIHQLKMCKTNRIVYRSKVAIGLVKLMNFYCIISLFITLLANSYKLQ